MDLQQVAIDTVTHSGTDTKNLVAGDKIKFEVEENGEDINLIDTVVPRGKKWELSVKVRIIETDA